ncbi:MULTISPECIES: alpha/beta fold hydrolase [unclassified Rathayibacter]|uniref:alpha/beta fold hydrolase n=1 Tax=unclassified Rathayibacter TaxID=2609250 RepID=UPI00188D60FC|nr:MULTISPECIES: alpha/beta hydrolase [unclassified Rathayibacter]MBF4462725.1 alpha/beta fold hydrolase [Rathayibacter sp. VKM Ac-2879]MBF4504139.1 alpha/beta fold hydrolase [Rathayibacter sp. VKM Ac-2878]
MAKKDRKRDRAVEKARDRGLESPRGGDTGDNAQLARMLDRLLAVQRPAVLANIRALRRRRPSASPEQIIASLERQYLSSVAAGGAAIGATAVVPGLGTVASVALSGAGAAGFLEASALFAQSVTEVHGIPLEDPERARALVLTLMMGSSGSELVRQVAGHATGAGTGLNQYWGSVVTKGLPSFLVGEIADRAKRSFTRHFLTQQGAGLVGRAMPFGIGAAIGGVGNAMLGRRVVQSARDAFGPAPHMFSTALVLEPTRAERRALTAAPVEPVELSVRDYGGAGERVALLLHGLGSDSRLWYALVPTLQEHGYRVLAPDLTGHGGSPTSPIYSPERWAADVRASVLQIPELIVGHGLGAVVASRLAADYRPEQLILLDPAFSDARGLAGALRRTGSLAQVEKGDADALRHRHPIWTDEQIELDISAHALWDPASADGLTARGAAEAPPVFPVPTLAVLPEDPLAHPSLADILVERGVEVRTVPGGGASLLREDRAALIAAVEGRL